MSEGPRKGSNFIVVCTSPNVCLTPLGPTMVAVPYQIVAFMDKASGVTAGNAKFVNYSSDVSVNGNPVCRRLDPMVSNPSASGDTKPAPTDAGRRKLGGERCR